MRSSKPFLFIAILALALGAWAAIAAAAPAGPDSDPRAAVAAGTPALTGPAAGPPVSVAPAAHPQAVLWDQPLSAANQNAFINQDFPDVPTYSTFLADDFANPTPWSIGAIFVPGDMFGGGTTLFNAAALNWQIYADCGGAPCGEPAGGGSPPVWMLALAPTDPQVAISNGSGGFPSDATLTLATPFTLPPGHWWLVFYPTMDFGLYGQHGRQPADTTNLHPGQAINPGGGYGVGTGWQNWMVWPGADRPDIAFRLEGSPGASIAWDKTIDGIPWAPGMEITRQTSDTIVVQEVLHLTPSPPPARQVLAGQPAGQAYADGVAAGSPAPAPPPAALTAIPPPPGATVINFDDVAAPCNFVSTTALRNQYAGLGVLFMGPAANDGGGILDQCGNFGVTGHSPPNFLAFNVNSGFGDGGIPRPPETITFINGASHVQVNAGSGSSAGQLVTMDAFNAGGALVGSDSLTLAPTLDTLSVTASGISYVVISSPAAVMVLDDLAFVPANLPVFTQMEAWDPAKLRLLDWAATGGQVIVTPDRLEWSGEIVAPATMTLTKWFHVEPCTWTETLLWEELWLDSVALEQRPVLIHKLPPDLWIDAVYQTPVYAGQTASFTLLYGNTGGFDNDVSIYNNFPPEAPFAGSVPPPDIVDPSGLFVQWDLGSLAQGDQGAIDVTVMVQPGLPPSTTIEIWDYISDHTDQVRDSVLIVFHVPHRTYLPLVCKGFSP